MFTGIVIAASIVGVLVLLVVLFVQRGREGLDTSPRALLRVYLYAASFAGIIALVVGLAALLNWGIATAAGYEVVWGGSPKPAIARICPPGTTEKCPSAEEQAKMERQENEQRRRQLGEELLRGLTFTVTGAVFYGAHRAARGSIAAGAHRAGRQGIAGANETRSGLRRAYLMLGTAVFGLATIILVPTGLYQLLANAIIETSSDVYRPGIADSFSPGVVSLVVWLLFLRVVVRELRPAEAAAQ